MSSPLPLTRLKQWKSMLMAGLNSWESAVGTKEALDPGIVFAFINPWEGSGPHSLAALLGRGWWWVAVVCVWGGSCLGFLESVKTGALGRQNKHANIPGHKKTGRYACFCPHRPPHPPRGLSPLQTAIGPRVRAFNHGATALSQTAVGLIKAG